MKRIETLRELVDLARDLGVRPDWHEPDEVEVTARVTGVQLNNTGAWPASEVTTIGLERLVVAGAPHPEPIPDHTELHVLLLQNEVPVAAVNLADLLAWATGYDDNSFTTCYDENREEIA